MSKTFSSILRTGNGTSNPLPVSFGGTGVTTSTGSGNNVLSISPTLTTPVLGVPSSGTLTYCTGLPLSTGVTGTLSVANGGTGTTVATYCSLTANVSGTLPVANGGTGVTTSTGSGNNVLSTSPTLVTPVLGVPSSGTLTYCTGLPLSTGVTGTLPVANGGTGTTVSTYCSLTANVSGTLPVANGGTGVTTSTGSGNNVLSISPTLTTPVLGTPTSGILSSCTVDGTNPVGYKNIPQTGSDKTTAYTLATGDVGKYIGVGTSGSVVVPTATFANGDVISIYNNTTGNITITTSAPTAYISGTNTVKTSITLATRGIATILFISATVCVVTGNVS